MRRTLRVPVCSKNEWTVGVWPGSSWNSVEARKRLTSLRLSFLLDKRMSKPLGIYFYLCLLGPAVAVRLNRLAVVPGEQVRDLEHMMQQMTLQQQVFMQTMIASSQQQQQSLMQSMEQELRQQFGNIAPVPRKTLGPPGGKLSDTTSAKRPFGRRERCLC